MFSLKISVLSAELERRVRVISASIADRAGNSTRSPNSKTTCRAAAEAGKLPAIETINPAHAANKAVQNRMTWVVPYDAFGNPVGSRSQPVNVTSAQLDKTYKRTSRSVGWVTAGGELRLGPGHGRWRDIGK